MKRSLEPLNAGAGSLASRQSLSWILLHTLAIGLSLASLLTGMRIATLSRPEVMHFTTLLPQGYVHGLHFLSAMGLVSVTAAYLVHHLFFREGKVRKHLGAGLYHRAVFWLGRFALLASITTGSLLYFGVIPSVALSDLHYMAALTMLLYILMHGGVYFVQFGLHALKRIAYSAAFHPGKDSVITITAMSVFVVAIVWTQEESHPGLSVQLIPITEFMQIDGIADETVWDQADAITVHTFGGANFPDGQTPITVKALHNGVEVFFHITWEDPTRSVRHLPLIKTETGWSVTGPGFYRFDETEYYEDKLAVMLAQNCAFGASKTAHLGPQPLADAPPNWHGKGYHYASDGEVRDLWHWKAVRTNDMILADDNFIGAPDAVRTGLRRYSAGYVPDGKESGAYLMNWQWYHQDRVVPKRLPRHPDDLVPYQSTGDASLSWVIPWYGYDLYNPLNDHYPPGTVMPSVLYSSNRFEGDRADVRARAVWNEGQWSLELARKLDTGSKLDVVLENGVCMWVAAFDHAQIAHTRHAMPVRLELGAVND